MARIVKLNPETGKPLVPGRERAFPWLLVSVPVAGVVLAAVALVRPPGPRPSTIPGKEERDRITARLGITHLDPLQGSRVVRAEAALKDPTPLFLPTTINAASRVEAPLAPLSDDGFPSFPPSFVYAPESAELHFPAVADVPERAEKGLQVGERGNPYRLLGRRDVEIPVASARLGRVEVIHANGSQAIPSISLPTVDVAVAGRWQPLELLVAVDRAGLVGSPTVVVSSTSDRWDDFWRQYLAWDFRLGERLDPGLYRVRVSP